MGVNQAPSSYHLSSPSSSSSSSSSLVFLLLLSISYGYSYLFVRKLERGFPRVIALFPVFYTLFVVPWCFPTSMLLRALSSFFLSWISSFKLLLFCFDRGDLILCKSYVEFVAVAGLPLKIKVGVSSSKARTLGVETILKMLLISIPFSVLSFHHAVLTFLGLLLGCLGRIVMPHLDVVPILNQPYRSTSLQVFWGKRWNRISSDILRRTICEPTREILEGFLGINLGKVVALVATLVVSGIMHEIMFYHMTCGMKPTWEVTKFFVLQGICMALEIAIKGFWTRNLRQPPLHPLISVLLTLSFVLVTSYWLLVLPVWRISGRACNSEGYGVEVVENLLHVSDRYI
ncbi:hypothetical protein Cgig2_027625 [Carnegiea gigantea]|uniref:Wax synthase domain-containing protein n=1 Tax=Carnegiea gigantea TaxID=171969 RepID=A0A9Q1GZJ8_9CARY|nr:hypothetical protein Cgig2_027625 [Carnegiea gigantea]